MGSAISSARSAKPDEHFELTDNLPTNPLGQKSSPGTCSVAIAKRARRSPDVCDPGKIRRILEHYEAGAAPGGGAEASIGAQEGSPKKKGRKQKASGNIAGRVSKACEGVRQAQGTSREERGRAAGTARAPKRTKFGTPKAQSFSAKTRKSAPQGAISAKGASSGAKAQGQRAKGKWLPKRKTSRSGKPRRKK